MEIDLGWIRKPLTCRTEPTWSDIELLVFSVQCKKTTMTCEFSRFSYRWLIEGNEQKFRVFWVLQKLKQSILFQLLETMVQAAKKISKKMCKKYSLSIFWGFLVVLLTEYQCWIEEKEIKIWITLNSYCALQISKI